MALVGINQMLGDARQRGYAVPGFCVWNAEMIRTVLQAADQHTGGCTPGIARRVGHPGAGYPTRY